MTAVFLDATDRKQAELDRERLQKEIIEAQQAIKTQMRSQMDDNATRTVEVAIAGGLDVIMAPRRGLEMALAMGFIQSGDGGGSARFQAIDGRI